MERSASLSFETRWDRIVATLLMGVPAALDSVLVTHPYYRSTYVFVSRQDRHLDLKSLDDPRLAAWRIGIHMVGDDYAPPAVAAGAARRSR